METYKKIVNNYISSVQLSHSVVSDSLQPYGLQQVYSQVHNTYTMWYGDKFCKEICQEQGREWEGVLSWVA